MTNPVYPTWNLDTTHTALLIIDMQSEFLKDMPALQANIAPLRYLRSVCHGLSVPVIYLQTEGQDNDIVADLAPAEDELVLTKPHYDGFYGTKLASILYELKIENLIISGVWGNLSCESTARSAFIRGFHVAFPSDVNGFADIAAQQATLRTIATFFGRTPASGEIIHELRRSLTQ